MKYGIILLVDKRQRDISFTETRKDIYSMTKIKIAAVIVCMIATGAFAGFTYNAANHSGDEAKVTVKTVSDDELTTDEIVTDEETTADEEVTDEETTADETVTEEETVPVKKTEPVETAAATTTTTAAPKTETAKLEAHRQEMAPAPVVTTAPVQQAEPETVTEQSSEAPAAEESAPVIQELPPVQSEPAAEETKEEVKEKTEEKKAEPAAQETEAPAVEAVPEETVPEEPAAEEDNGRKIQVTDEEYIWLCNVVGHEYGSDWIDESEKAKVVEVIMNRVNDPRFPDTIWDVLTQPNQFSGLEWTLYLGDFSYQVTPSVKAAVDMYLEHPEDFDHGYLGFWGDGSMNHFYSI